jgi:hypothetical protein
MFGIRKSSLAPILRLILGAPGKMRWSRFCTPQVEPGVIGKQAAFWPAMDPLAAYLVVPTATLAGSL